MNKYTILILLGVITVVLTESPLKRDKDALIKALKEKFNQYKKQKQLDTKSAGNANSDAQASPPAVPQEKKHEKAANAIGLALLDVSKPKQAEKQEEKTTSNSDEDDDMQENTDDEDINVEMSSKKDDKSQTKPKEADKNVPEPDTLKTSETNLNVKTSDTKKENKHINIADDSNKDEDEGNDEEKKNAENKDKKADENNHKDKDEESQDDAEKDKDSGKKIKDTAKALKESAKRLKDKDLQTVNVGQLKKLLASSVENLDKAGKAIQSLLQYDEEKKAHSRQKQVTPSPYQGYPQQGYGGYPQQQSPYQTTCPGQCNNLCAPSCRDPCCRFPPSIGMNPSPPVQARGSYQQGLINAYPPQTQLGGNQANYQPQSIGQQCGQQCSAQSCAPSCSPSCCSPPRNQIVPQGQANAGCPMSCLNNCAPSCHARCCVPGRK